MAKDPFKKGFEGEKFGSYLQELFIPSPSTVSRWDWKEKQKIHSV